VIENNRLGKVLWPEKNEVNGQTGHLLNKLFNYYNGNRVLSGREF
jgi:hypothetical protein